MRTADVTTLGLLASLLLVVVAIAISFTQRLGLERDIVWATIRSLIQLLFVGAVLAFVIDPNQPIALSWAWVAAMVAFAGVVIKRRAPEIPAMLPLGMAAIGTAAAVTLLVIFGIGVFPLEGRTLVPLAGMMIGNSMNATVLAARRVVDEFKDHRGPDRDDQGGRSCLPSRSHDRTDTRRGRSRRGCTCSSGHHVSDPRIGRDHGNRDDSGRREATLHARSAADSSDPSTESRPLRPARPDIQVINAARPIATVSPAIGIS